MGGAGWTPQASSFTRSRHGQGNLPLARRDPKHAPKGVTSLALPSRLFAGFKSH